MNNLHKDLKLIGHITYGTFYPEKDEKATSCIAEVYNQNNRLVLTQINKDTLNLDELIRFYELKEEDNGKKNSHSKELFTLRGLLEHAMNYEIAYDDLCNEELIERIKDINDNIANCSSQVVKQILYRERLKIVDVLNCNYFLYKC